MNSDRRLLGTKTGGPPPPETGGRGRAGFGRGANFDTNMVIILAALLCVLICALGINSIVRYILRCIGRANDGDELQPPRFSRSGIGKAVLRQIPVAVYSLGEEVGATECPICLAEFMDGDKIRILPKCHHCFHVRCVDVWLASHSSCPTCRQVLVEEAEEGGTRPPAIGDAPAAAAAGGGLTEEVG